MAGYRYRVASQTAEGVRVRSATRKKTGKDPEYLAWIRSLPCVCCFRDYFATIPFPTWHQIGQSQKQRTGSESAHVGDRGLSQKCQDREAVPLCKWHHTEGPNSSHHRLGKRFFERWRIDKAALISELQKRYEEQNGTHKAD